VHVPHTRTTHGKSQARKMHASRFQTPSYVCKKKQREPQRLQWPTPHHHPTLYATSTTGDHHHTQSLSVEGDVAPRAARTNPILAFSMRPSKFPGSCPPGHASLGAHGPPGTHVLLPALTQRSMGTHCPGGCSGGDVVRQQPRSGGAGAASVRPSRGIPGGAGWRLIKFH
jgi:hypothetical protein